MKNGISLITISVSILILLTLSTVITVGLVNNYNQSQKIELANELEMIQIAVDNYKQNNGSYPITDESLIISNVSDNIKNSQFSEEDNISNNYSFSVIDYSKIGIKNLKNGTGKEYNDKYVVSTYSGNVYYAKGKQIGNNKYYSLTGELSGILGSKGKLENNSDDPIKFEDILENDKLSVRAYVPKIYTVQSVTYENENVSLKSTEDVYYIYEVTITKIGTLIINYNYSGKNKITKYTVEQSKLNFAKSTNKMYTLTFDANGGVCNVKTITKPQDYSIIMPIATKEEEKFIGWYTEVDGGDKVEYTKMPNYNQTLYARYAKKHNFTLVTGTGTTTTGSSETGRYFSGDTITLKASAQSGYNTPTWVSSDTSLVANQSSANTTITMPDGDITMTSSATLMSYSISYSLGGGSASNPTSYNKNSYFSLNAPTRSGYTFKGWTGSNGSTPQTTVTINGSTMTGNKSYTANWNAAIQFSRAGMIYNNNKSYKLSGSGGGGGPNGGSGDAGVASAILPANVTVYYTLGCGAGGDGSGYAAISYNGTTIASVSTSNGTQSKEGNFRTSVSASIYLSYQASGQYGAGTGTVDILKIVDSSGNELTITYL